MINLDIKLNNIHNEETVNYSLLLIKGSITLENDVCSDLNGSIQCKTADYLTVWPVLCGNFKCMVQLQKGSNTVSLIFNDFSKEFIFYFSVHETDYCVIPIYLIPEGHNGEFQAPKNCDNSIKSALNKIGFGIKMIQCLFAEKLIENGFKGKSFQIEHDLDNSVPVCREFRSKLSLDQVKRLNEEELWVEVAKELMMSEIGCDTKKYVCFLSCTFWTGTEVLADPALGGGGLALLGSASLHSWPGCLSEVLAALTNSQLIEPSLLDNSCYRGTYSGLFGTSLGSTVHEMGHIFNLGHTGSGLMARGFDNAHLVFLQTSPSDELETGGGGLEERSEACLEVRDGSQIPIRLISQPYLTADRTHLEPNSAAILAYHRWFNASSSVTSSSSNIRFDRNRHLISSCDGLRVIELREGSTGAVWKSWRLKGSGRHFLLPSLLLGTRTGNFTLLAIDSQGSMLSETI